MFQLSIFNDFCSWWWLWWILPFLLGLLLGWLLWGKFKSLLSEIELKDKKIYDLESRLDDCKQNNLALKTNSDDKPSQFVASTVRAEEPQATTDTNLGISATPTKYDKIGLDNLQIIEGIGPKMESVLKENGVNTYIELANTSDSELKTILEKYGDKYRIINPNEWNDQARYAKEGRWDELIKFQKQLGSITNDETDSKLEKIMIKLKLIKRFKQDDLKAVEGIGPKIEGLLHDAGIKTWASLSETPLEKLKSILDAAGPRYRISDPGTWPKQSEYLANGMWDELEEYQDFLQGGRNPK